MSTGINENRTESMVRIYDVARNIVIAMNSLEKCREREKKTQRAKCGKIVFIALVLPVESV